MDEHCEVIIQSVDRVTLSLKRSIPELPSLWISTRYAFLESHQKPKRPQETDSIHFKPYLPV